LPLDPAELLGRVAAVAQFKTTLTKLHELEAVFTRLLELAFIDPTTQLFNRRAFNEYAATLPPVSYAAAFLDLTGFKSINERFTHEVGDFALAHVGEHLERVCQPAAIPFRYGGDEFVVLISTQELPTFVENNASLLRWNPFRFASEGQDAVSIPFGASIGIAEPVPDISVDALVKRAEKAAKISKRREDAIVLWQPEHDDEAPSVDLRRRCTSCPASANVIVPKMLVRDDLLASCPVCGSEMRAPI
jgi:diguanylate cyclase (GGDEF)-like protein